jgi:hypothetical protein
VLLFNVEGLLTMKGVEGVILGVKWDKGIDYFGLKFHILG